jgi:glycosyltransferase involved in cell wall biosynthesis
VSLFIVIPVRNEATRLEAGLQQLRIRLEALGFSHYQVLISDNGSTDQTFQALQRFNQQHGTAIGYVRASDEPDKGMGIASGWALAPETVTVLAYCDIDMATDPIALVTGYQLIESGQADAVAGSRWLPASQVIGRTFIRTFLSAGLSLAWRLLPQGCLTDPGCGLKLVRRVWWVRVSKPTGRLGFVYGAEVLELLARQGYFIQEIPVTWTDDDAGRIRVQQAITDYLRGWWRLFKSF